MSATTTEDIEDYLSRFGGELTAFVKDRLSSDESEDLLQEVWTSFALAAKEEVIEDPRAWLYRAARNRLTDHYRLANRRPQLLDDWEEDELIDELEDELELELDSEEFWSLFDEALHSLPEAQSEVFERNVLEGETLQEIADDLGERLKTIISRKQYARQKLQAYLADYYEQLYYD